MTRRPRQLGLAVLALAVVAGGWWLLVGREPTDGQTAMAPPPFQPVSIALVQREDVPIVVRGLGAVQAYNTYTARSRVDGNIVDVAYREGQKVRAGDLLIQIDPRPYQAALMQAKANLLRDQAQLANAQRDLGRYKTLIKPGLTTQQIYDTQRAQVDQSTAVVSADQAQVTQAQLNVEYAAIRAPFDGRTGQRLVDVGNLVHATDQTALVVLTQMQPIFVSFTLPEVTLERVRQAGQQGAVDVEAYDSTDQHKRADGRLSVIDNSVDQTTGMVRLKAEFANDDEALWPGEFINAHLIESIRRNGLIVPSVAVQMGPNGRFVYRVRPDDTVEAVAVEVAQIEAGTALIDKGLQGGDRVVVAGTYGLEPGAKVTISGPPVEARPQANPASSDLTGRTVPPVEIDPVPGAGSQISTSPGGG